MQEKKNKIFEMLKVTASLYDEVQTREKLTSYTEYLCEYDIEQISRALYKVPRISWKFPTLREIFTLLDPQLTEKDTAYEMVGTILSAARAHGGNEGEAAMKALSSREWSAVQNFGGWKALCGDNDPNILRAQLRDSCMSAMSVSKVKEAAMMIENEKRSVINFNTENHQQIQIVQEDPIQAEKPRELVGVRYSRKKQPSRIDPDALNPGGNVVSLDFGGIF